jgi:hypothetical protein
MAVGWVAQVSVAELRTGEMRYLTVAPFPRGSGVVHGHAPALTFAGAVVKHWVSSGRGSATPIR